MNLIIRRLRPLHLKRRVLQAGSLFGSRLSPSPMNRLSLTSPKVPNAIQNSLYLGLHCWDDLRDHSSICVCDLCGNRHWFPTSTNTRLEQYLPQSAGDGGTAVGALIGGLCASPFAGLLSVVFFALGVAIIQWIAKLFGGTGTYEKLLYAFAAITVPFTIVSSLFALLSAIPYVGICTGIISFGLGIYALVLQVMAVKAVNRFGWGQAAGSVFIPGCVVFIVCACRGRWRCNAFGAHD